MPCLGAVLSVLTLLCWIGASIPDAAAQGGESIFRGVIVEQTQMLLVCILNLIMIWVN